MGSGQPRRLPPSRARRFRGDSARGAPGSITFAIQSVSWVYCLPLLSHLPRRKPRPNGTAHAQQDGAPGGGGTRGQSPQLRSQPPPPPASRWDVLPTGSSGPTRGPAALCPAVRRGGEHTGSGPAERGDPWAGSRRPPQPHPGCPASPTRRRARLCHMAAAGREEEEPSQRKPHPSSRSRSCSQPGSILSPGLSCILLAQPRAGRAAQMGAKSVGTPPGAVRAVPCCTVPHDPPGPACRWGLTNPVLVQDQTPRPSSLDLCADLQPCPVDPHLSHPCPHPISIRSPFSSHPHPHPISFHPHPIPIPAHTPTRRM